MDQNPKLTVQQCEEIAERNLEAAESYAVEISEDLRNGGGSASAVIAATYADVAHAAIALAFYKQQFGPSNQKPLGRPVSVLNPRNPR